MPINVMMRQGTYLHMHTKSRKSRSLKQRAFQGSSLSARMRKTNNTIDNRHSVSFAPHRKAVMYLRDICCRWHCGTSGNILTGCNTSNPQTPSRNTPQTRNQSAICTLRWGGLAQKLSDDAVVGLREGLCREQTNLALTSYLQGRYQLVRVLREKQCKTDNFTNAINKKILTQDTIHLKGE